MDKCTKFQADIFKTNGARVMRVNMLARALLGTETPPCTFPGIAQKRKGIELRNFQNLFLHQFCTC